MVVCASFVVRRHTTERAGVRDTRPGWSLAWSETAICPNAKHSWSKRGAMVQRSSHIITSPDPRKFRISLTGGFDLCAWAIQSQCKPTARMHGDGHRSRSSGDSGSSSGGSARAGMQRAGRARRAARERVMISRGFSGTRWESDEQLYATFRRQRVARPLPSLGGCGRCLRQRGETGTHPLLSILVGVAGSRQQAAGSRKQAASSRQQAASSKRQAAGSKEQAAGSNEGKLALTLERLD